MDPTRIDAGHPEADLEIHISVNARTKQISITGAVDDPVLFAFVMGQALLTHSQHQMELRRQKAADAARRIHTV
jgi:hypothetical protein